MADVVVDTFTLTDSGPTLIATGAVDVHFVSVAGGGVFIGDANLTSSPTNPVAIGTSGNGAFSASPKLTLGKSEKLYAICNSGTATLTLLKAN